MTFYDLLRVATFAGAFFYIVALGVLVVRELREKH